jgi:hypothetical protein
MIIRQIKIALSRKKLTNDHQTDENWGKAAPAVQLFFFPDKKNSSQMISREMKIVLSWKKDHKWSSDRLKLSCQEKKLTNDHQTD